LVGLFLLDGHSPSSIIIPYSSSIAHVAAFSAWLSFAGEARQRGSCASEVGCEVANTRCKVAQRKQGRVADARCKVGAKEAGRSSRCKAQGQCEQSRACEVSGEAKLWRIVNARCKVGNRGSASSQGSSCGSQQRSSVCEVDGREDTKQSMVKKRGTKSGREARSSQQWGTRLREKGFSINGVASQDRDWVWSQRSSVGGNSCEVNVLFTF
jgi:hypothetical protein